ncbi:hypothetical protein CAPTEDRAFT_208625 [Capitella teleta]|uniref:Uncharacterized protein n=1 Tax=Capitella teleta TaxID=283909 RepID=R7TUY9_CAPTE|nr:hypothetical protein CAPTEDRAFT_208625 [Capitella teleta]|eukprot:ELT94800.1 hypothetical protein CAPTEDRAFT_208625 [Capitella teleta]
MGSSYSFKDGKTTFYNKYYDTRLNDIWKSYDMNMTNSKAFFQTAFAPYDFEQFSRLEAKLSKPGKVSSTGHVAFWQIGDRVAVWGESESGVEIDVHSVELIGDLIRSKTRTSVTPTAQCSSTRPLTTIKNQMEQSGV